MVGFVAEVNGGGVCISGGGCCNGSGGGHPLIKNKHNKKSKGGVLVDSHVRIRAIYTLTAPHRLTRCKIWKPLVISIFQKLDQNIDWINLQGLNLYITHDVNLNQEIVVKPIKWKDKLDFWYLKARGSYEGGIFNFHNQLLCTNNLYLNIRVLLT